jgi:hypothetical protein
MLSERRERKRQRESAAATTKDRKFALLAQSFPKHHEIV